MARVVLVLLASIWLVAAAAPPAVIVLTGDFKAAPAPAARAMLARFGSARDVDYPPLFNGGSHLPGLPERAGYFLGYLVVQQIAEGRDMVAMAHWSPAKAEPLVRATLERMAGTCGPRQSRGGRRTSSDAVASASPAGAERVRSQVDLREGAKLALDPAARRLSPPSSS